MRSALARNARRGSSFAVSSIAGVTLRHPTKSPAGLLERSGDGSRYFAFCRSAGDNVRKTDRCEGVGPPIHPMDSARHVDLPAALDDRADHADPAQAPLRVLSAARRAGEDARKRVLFVIPTMSGGGAERVFLHLMNHLDRARFEPTLAVGSGD